MQFALLACGLVSFLTIVFFLPETSHPQTRGIDKARMMEELSSERQESKRLRWVWLNPMASLWLLRSPNLLFVVCVFRLFSQDGSGLIIFSEWVEYVGDVSAP
jgi:hypothetical protein